MQQSSPLISKKRNLNTASKFTANITPYDEDKEASDDKAARKCVRPTWGPHGELFYMGSIEGGRPRGFGDIRASGLGRAKLSFTAGPIVSIHHFFHSP